MKLTSFFSISPIAMGALAWGCAGTPSSPTQPRWEGGQDATVSQNTPSQSIRIYSFDDPTSPALGDFHREIAHSHLPHVVYKTNAFHYFKIKITPSPSPHAITTAIHFICSSPSGPKQAIFLVGYGGGAPTAVAVAQGAHKTCGAPVVWVGLVAPSGEGLLVGQNTTPLHKSGNTNSSGGERVWHLEKRDVAVTLWQGGPNTGGPPKNLSPQLLHHLQSQGFSLPKVAQERKELEDVVKSLKGKWPMDKILDHFKSTFGPHEIQSLLNPWVPRVGPREHQNPLV